MHGRMRGALESCLLQARPRFQHNNMAAVMEVNVSHEIDHLTNSMDFYEDKRLAIWREYLVLSWRKFFDVIIDWRGSESKI